MPVAALAFNAGDIVALGVEVQRGRYEHWDVQANPVRRVLGHELARGRALRLDAGSDRRGALHRGGAHVPEGDGLGRLILLLVLLAVPASRSPRRPETLRLLRARRPRAPFR